MRYEAAVQDLQEAAIWQTAAHFVPNDLKGSAAAQRAVLKEAMAKLQAESPADYEALRARYRTAWNTLDAAAEAMRTSAALGIAVRSCMHLLKAAMPLRSTEGRQMYAALKNAMEAHLAALKRTDALARGIALWPESKAVLEAALRNPRNGFEYFAGRYAAARLAVRPGARARSVRNARKAAKKAQRRLEAAMSEADDAKAERNAFLEAKGDIYSDEYEAALEVLKNARKAMHLAARMRNEARASLEAARNAEADANAKLEDIRAAIRSSEALGNGVAVCIQMLGRARPLESTEACRTFAGLKAAMTAYMAMLQRADGRPATAL